MKNDLSKGKGLDFLDFFVVFILVCLNFLSVLACVKCFAFSIPLHYLIVLTVRS